MVKWGLRSVGALSLLLLAATAWIVGRAAFAGRSDAAEIAYLQRNATALNLKADDAGFRFPQTVYDQRLILLGEAHGVAVGQILDLALLRHLSARTGVRNYVAEIDPAQAAAFNAYLETGDESRLDRVFADWARIKQQWGNADFKRKIMAIRALNQELPPERKIRFLGMDRLQDAALACDHLNELARRIEPSGWSGVALVRGVVAKKDACSDSSKQGALTVAGPGLRRLVAGKRPEGVAPQDWRELVAMAEMLADRSALKTREDTITAAFDRLAADPSYAGEKFYGLWGMFHVMQKTVNGVLPLAHRLRTGTFSNQLVSIATFNLDSEMMMPVDALPIVKEGKGGYGTMAYSMDSPILAMLEGVGSLKAAMKGNMTLFAMNAPGTPYRTGHSLGRIHGLFGYLQKFEVDVQPEDKYPAADYALVARGSAATEPFVGQALKP